MNKPKHNKKSTAKPNPPKKTEVVTKSTSHEPVPVKPDTPPDTPPMMVHADVEKTPVQAAPNNQGFTSGGDIIIRLSQVELNQRLNEVGEQTQRANDISTQIAEAFNAMGEQYEKGWEVSRSETDETRTAIKTLTEQIKNHEKAFENVSANIDSVSANIERVSADIERQISRELETVTGSVSTLNEGNNRQQTLLTRLLIFVVVLLLVSIGLHFMPQG